MPRSSIRRAMVAAGAAPVLALTLTPPTFGASADPGPSPTRTFTATPLTASDAVSANKAPSSRLARTPQELLKRTDSARVNVMIKYDYDATASYAGGVRSLAATSPGVTKRKLTGKSAAEKAYAAYQSTQERTISAAVRRAVPSATIGQSYQVVYGGVAASRARQEHQGHRQGRRRRRRPARRAATPADRRQLGLHQRDRTAEHPGRRGRAEERRQGHPLRQPRQRRLARAPVIRRPGQPECTTGALR